MSARLTGFSPIVRNQVWGRANGCCERCGLALPIHGGQYHHRRPRGAGGSRRPDTNLASNCLLLDAACHVHIEAHRTDALDAGWLISQHRKNITPAEIPVQLHDGYYLLGEDGQRYAVPSPHRESA